MKSLEKDPWQPGHASNVESSTQTFTAYQGNGSSELGKTILFSPRVITKFLLLVTLFLTVSHLAVSYLENTFPEQSRVRRIIVPYFHFGAEANFPTFFSALLLLFSAAITFCIYKMDLPGNNKKNGKYWLSLSFILLFLSADEAVQIHEHLMGAVHYIVPDLPGIFASAWVIPYAVIFLAIGFYFLRFVFGLPKRTRNMIIFAGAVFVVGALVLEVAETYIINEFGAYHVLFILNMTLQEAFEMAGIILFIYALLDYISLYHNGLVVKVK